MSPPTVTAADPDVISGWAGKYDGIRTRIEKAMNDLGTVLAGSGSMAGSDTAGKNFSTQYDPAAANTIDLGSSCVLGAGMLHDLLQATAASHANADQQSRYQPNPNELVYPPGASAPYEPPLVPKSFGGDGGVPGWLVPLREWVQGELWPDGRIDTLRATGHAWQSAGTVLSGIASDAQGMCRQMSGDFARLPEAQQIENQVNALGTATNSCAAQCTAIGQACLDYAQNVDDAQNQIIHIALEFLAISAASEAAGVLGTAFTCGVSDGAAQGGVAVAGAAAAARIAQIIEAMITAAEASALPTVAAGAASLRSGATLAPLLSAQAAVWLGEAQGALPAFTSADRFPYRPYIRVGTKRWVIDQAKEVIDSAGKKYWRSSTDRNVLIPQDGTYPSSVTSLPKDERGWYYVDEATGLKYPVNSTPVMGHETNDEWWRIQQMAFKKKWTNQQLNDYINDPANRIFRLEDAPGNWSHQFEKPR